MSKKTFKDKTEHLDRFFSEPEEENKTHEPQGTHKKGFPAQTGFPSVPAGFPGGFPATPLKPAKKEYYRINLKLDIEHKEYLSNAAWKKKKSITQYINDLIEMDKTSKDT